MGMLAKALSPASSYAAKNAGTWEALMERLTNCMVSEDVDAFEQHVVGLGLAIPPAWEESLTEVVEKRRAEIEDENITEILKAKFDF